MEKTTEKIGIREYVAILLIVMGIKLTDDTPAILVKKLGSAIWMAPLIIGLISIIPIYFTIRVVTLYENKNLYDCLLHLFGKFFGNIISFVTALFGFAAVIIDSGVYVDIIVSMYYERSPTVIIYIILISVCAYIAKKGIEQLGTIAWILLFYIAISIISALLFSLSDAKLPYLFPIFGPGVLEVLKESAEHISIYADFFYIALIAPFIVSNKAYKKGALISLTIVTIALTLSFIVFVAIFDYEGLKMLNYPYHELIRFVQLGFLNNVETFFLPFWVVATFIRFAVYFYLLAVFFGRIFNIKHFEYIIPSLAAITVIIGMAPETPTFTIFFLRDSLLHLLSPMFVLLPLLMWLMAKLKGDFKNEKTNHTE